jgi:hypothetical protein
MTAKDDRDLPLHDEAEARSKWRGGETVLGRDESGISGPADTVSKTLPQRPPD